MTVYAQWNPYYNITFDSNGGTACNPATVTREKGTKWGTLCTTTRTGYNFAGWKDQDGNTVTKDTVCAKNLTLKAQWTGKAYTLTYDNNNGSGCTKKAGKYDQAWGDLCTPTRTGYKFTGWKSNGATITKDTICKGNITAVANWTINSYKLTYNDNGGTGCSTRSISKNYNESWGPLCTPTRTGYTFNAWKNGATIINSNSKATANITVKADWTANKYTLRYNDNGGTGCASSTISKSYNETWGTLCTPTKSGYKFTGWKSNNTTITASTKATGNITVVAQWEKLVQKTYTGTVSLIDYYNSPVIGYDQSLSCKTYESSCTASTSTKYIKTRSGTLAVINSQTFTLNKKDASFTHDWDFYNSYYKTDSSNGLNARKSPNTNGSLVDGLNIGHHFYPSRIAYDSGSGCANHIWAYGYSYEEGWSGWVCSYYLF